MAFENVLQKVCKALFVIVFLEVFCLLENFLENLIVCYRRVAVFCQYQDKVHFQFGFYIVTCCPVGIF